VLKSREKNHILPYKWLFWWVFNFCFLREDVKYAKNEVHELLFHVQIVHTQTNTYTAKKIKIKNKTKEEEAENSY
jgi:hypothetical protein